MELLQVADTVAREKGIDKELVVAALEEAIQKAGRSKYGYEHDIRAIVNRKTGGVDLYRFLDGDAIHPTHVNSFCYCITS